MRSLIQKFYHSSTQTKLSIAALITIWMMVFVALVGGLVLLAEQRSVAQEPGTTEMIPILTLSPTSGTLTTPITLQGSGWMPGSTVLVYLSTMEATELPPYAVTSVVPDAAGQFVAMLTFPANVNGEAGRAIKVIAREIGRDATTHAFYTLSDFGGQLTDKPDDTTPTAPTVIPTGVVVPVQDTLPPPIGTPQATANTNVNIRSGPGMVYPVIGLLATGQSAEVTGVSPDRAWWQIKFNGAIDGRGWVAGAYLTAQNTANLPVVQLVVIQPTPAPAIPTPVPPPAVIITDWRGEYFNNPNLSGAPVLVRNDPVIQFSWGAAAPGPGVNADNFSARWARSLYFGAGNYRFKVLVDDGVRLWVDDRLVIDRWYPTDPKTYTADVYLNEGTHHLRLEYFEYRYDAQVRLDWERLKTEESNRSPVASAGDPYTLKEGNTVTLDGRGSKDPDGKIAGYEWDFDFKGRDFSVDATGPTASARYTDGPASIVVALRVTDNKGATATATARVTVENVPPVVTVSGPYNGVAGTPLSMSGTATDAGYNDQFGLRYIWDFGDGTQDFGPVVIHTYTRPGTYTARLTVLDKDGGQGTTTTTVNVAPVTSPNQPPQAVITGPDRGLIDEMISFSGRNSNDDGRIVAWLWDFGDGSTANGENVQHNYRNSGTYQVILTVTDNGGLTGRATSTVQIDRPTPVNQPPVAVINAPASARVGEEIPFDGSGSTDSDGTIGEWVWDFSDGVRVNGDRVTHTFGETGSYEVLLTVTDNNGASGQASYTIVIEPPAPSEIPPTDATEEIPTDELGLGAPAVSQLIR